MKQRLIWFDLQRDGTRSGLSNIKETFPENLQLQVSVLCQFFAFWPNYEHIFQEAGLSSSYMMAGQTKCKEKVPDVSDTNQNAETTCNSKLHNLRFIHQKCAEKLVKDNLPT